MTFADNRHAKFEYDIKDALEAGVELFGHEVKSIRAGHASLKGAYVVVKGGEAWLLNMHVTPYSKASASTLAGYDPTRSRKLLMHKSQIVKLLGEKDTKGLTIVPLSVYDSAGKIKVKVGVGRKRKTADKREYLKEKDIARESREQ